MIKKLVKNIVGLGNVLKIKNIIKPFKIEEIIIDVSASCNAQCPFCPRVFMPEERSKGFISLDLYRKILDDAKNNNIKKLRLYSTAEPTMHPKFDQIIDIAKEKNFEISLSTNASLLHKHIDSIMKVDFLQYSIEGWDKESYEKYRFPLKFEGVYENIKEFHKYASKQAIAPKVSTNLLLTTHTNIKKYIDLWGEYIGEINLHFMYNPVKYENGKFRAKSLDTESEYFELDRQVKNFYCEYPFNILTVAYDGKVALCCDDFAAELNIGDLSYNTIKEVFYSEAMNEIRNQFYTQKLDICQDCSRFSKPNKKDVEYIIDQLRQIVLQKQKKINFKY